MRILYPRNDIQEIQAYLPHCTFIRAVWMRIEPIKADNTIIHNTQWWLYTSKHAVYEGYAHLNRSHPHWYVAAMGPGTASALLQYGRQVDVQPPEPCSSETLLPVLLSKHPQSVTLVKGQNGRDVLSQFFSKQKIAYQIIEVYRRVYDAYELDQWLASGESIDGVIVTSVEMLRYFHWFLSQNRPASISQIIVITLSERIAQEARLLGFLNVCASVQTSLEGLARAIHLFFHPEGQ